MSAHYFVPSPQFVQSKVSTIIENKRFQVGLVQIVDRRKNEAEVVCEKTGDYLGFVPNDCLILSTDIKQLTEKIRTLTRYLKTH